MTKLRKYAVYLDDGRLVFKAAVPAENEKAACDYCFGNGEVVAVKDITDEFQISLEKVTQALRRSEFGAMEIAMIQRVLIQTGVAE